LAPQVLEVQELAAEVVAQAVVELVEVVVKGLVPLAEEAEVLAEPAAAEVKDSLSRELDLLPLRRVRVYLLR